MKSHKMLVLASLAAGSMVLCGSAFGQESTTSKVTATTTNATSHASQMFAGWNMDKLAQQLGLSDSQKEKVNSIFESERQQMRDVHQNLTMSTGERRSKVDEIRDSANTRLKLVLTPEQYSKWKNMTHHRVMPSNAPAR